MKSHLKSHVQSADATRRLQYLKSCPIQGSLQRLPSFHGEVIWANVVSHLYDKVLSFAINAVQDVLPHNVNLHRWHKENSKACPLCGQNQTLMHVLNNCKASLHSNRYTWRHNSVLGVIAAFVKCSLPESWRMIVDLPEHFYCFPVNLEDCVLRPDLVIWNPMFKQILLFELTIPLEENIMQAAQFKESRYKPLREKLIRSGWWAKIHPIQVGSRGLLDVASFGPLLKLTACSNKRSQQSLLTQLSRISLCCSFAIWCRRNKKDWEDRSLFD